MIKYHGIGETIEWKDMKKGKGGLSIGLNQQQGSSSCSFCC